MTLFEQELVDLLVELVAIEGPQPGTSIWYKKVVAAIKKSKEQKDG